MALRVGLIGCGNVAQMIHIPYLMEYEQFELVALADSYAPILEAIADRYGITRRYTNPHDLITQPDIEAVWVTHSGSHYETIVAALDAGKHVFTEKPLTWNARQARDLAERAAQSDRIIQVGYHKRYDPAFAYARDQIKAMQDVGFVRVTVLHPPDEMGHTPHRIRRGEGQIKEGHQPILSWQEQVDGQREALGEGNLAPLVDEALGENRKDDPRLRLGYGIITVSLIHQVYMLYGLLGEPERVIRTDIWRDGLSIHSMIAYPGDMRCSLDWHFLSHIKDYREEYAIYGNHERVTLQFPSPYFKNFPSPVILQGGEGELSWEKRVIVSYDEAFRNEILAFHENVTHNRQPATGIEEAARHMAFIQQLIDAAT